MDELYSMYKIRPIIKIAEELELPKCMYRMKVIQISHSNDTKQSFENDNVASVNQEQKNDPEVTALENRQEAILLQLSHLKQQLSSLREQLKNPQELQSSVIVHAQTPSFNEGGLLEEIVVKANPKWPPYSLLALDHVLNNAITIQCSTHSAVELPEGLENFQRISVSPIFNIRLIWKQVQETEFVISPTKHSVIQSEVNLLRFLSRMGPRKYNYESSDNVAVCVADALLDLCYQLAKETNIKMRLTLLRAFGEVLGKHSFLTGNTISVVDIALWSTLKQINNLMKISKDVPDTISKWLAVCSNIFGANAL